MAVPSYATDLNDIYTDTDNFSTVGGGRATATETDDYIQGNNCWSHDPFSSGIEGGMYDDGTAPTITADDCVYVWTKCDVAATLATHANGGIQVIMGTSTSAYDCFYVLGSDDYQYGGWKCIPVDPTSSPSTSVGTPGSYDWFGVRWNVPSSGASKGYPMKIDAMRYGRSASVTAGEVANPATWAGLAAYDATSTRQWGICQPNAAGVEIQGIVNWGTASTACYFDDDSGSTVIIIDTEWTSTDFTKIIIDHASTTFNMDGLTIKALGTNNPGQLIFNNASTTSALDNNTFDSIGITTLRAGVTATGNKWKGCGLVTTNGASLTSCVFDSSSGTSAITVATLNDLDNCSFTMGASGHAVELTGAATSYDWDCTLSGYDTGSVGDDVEITGGSITGDEAIHITATTGTFTISVGSTGTTPSVSSAGAAVNVVAGARTVKIVAQTDTGTKIQSARAFLAVSETGSLPYQQAITSISRSTTTATVTFTAAHGLKTGDKLLLAGITDKTEDNATHTVTVSSTTVCTFSTTDEGSTAYTGTIVGTYVYLKGLTDVNGEISISRSFGATQAATGWARKSSAEPYYKQGAMAGDVSSSADTTFTATLISDD